MGDIRWAIRQISIQGEEGREGMCRHKERTGKRGVEECGLEWESGPGSGWGKRGWVSARCLSASSDELSCRRQWQ